jgi:hypothetical protein
MPHHHTQPHTPLKPPILIQIRPFSHQNNRNHHISYQKRKKNHQKRITLPSTAPNSPSIFKIHEMPHFHARSPTPLKPPILIQIRPFSHQNDRNHRISYQKPPQKPSKTHHSTVNRAEFLVQRQVSVHVVPQNPQQNKPDQAC